MLRIKTQTWLYAIVVSLALALTVLAGTIYPTPESVLAQSPDTDCAKDGSTCPMTGDFGPISVDAAPPGAWALTAPGAPAFGALVYDPDFKLIEQEARARLKRGLDAREALSPYKGNVEFDTYVKKFDYEAGWNRAYSGYDPYGDTLTLIDLIDRADQDLREARDLYAYLLVYAPEYRFRADSYYISDVHTDQGFTEPLCGVTDKEDPDPADPLHSGQVLDPVIDWCNFRARLRQSVREAANLRMIFGQQFMVDAMGLHFSGTEFYGGEEAVRGELAQLRAAKHQYELAEQGLTEALDRAVGSGCYVSDFYTQSEWSLMSRVIEGQETAQHHIGVRLSYMDVDSPEQVGQADAAAQEAFRQASVNGYIKLIGMASLGAAQPLGVGCDKGERPDGLLAAEMALNLLETRRKSHELADGRNIFGFDVTFTPARPYKSSVAMNCNTTSPGDRGLWDEAWCAAEYAKELQNDEVNNTRAFDDSQEALRAEVEEIRDEIAGRITTVSGCTYANDFGVLGTCVNNQTAYLNTCLSVMTSTVAYDAHNQLIPSAFDNCMNNPAVKNGEAKQALHDLRNIYVQYFSIVTKSANIKERVALSDQRNATVSDWLGKKGYWERAARVSEVAYEAVNCVDFSADVWKAGTYVSTAACAATTAVWAGMAGHAGTTSMQADVTIENEEHNREVKNLLIDQSELLIDAYAANQQFYSKKAELAGLLDGLTEDVVELQRQLAYFQHSPANDPGFRMVRDSSRMQLAKQMEYAARMSYLAARRAEYAYAARLSASNFRISDIYRSRTADDIKRYLQTLLGVTNSLAGGASYQTDPNDITISIAQHWLQLTDEALAKEGILPDEIETERVARFREWVATNTFTNTDGKEVLQFSFTTSLLDGGLFSNVILQGYDGYWLHKLSGIAEPKLTNNGVSLNLVSEEADMYYRTTRLTQGGLVHLQSHSGCTFDYRLMAPAVLLGLEWASNQDPEVATATFWANVNETYPYTQNGFRTSAFLGRSVSSTDWEITIFAGAPSVGMADMDLQQLTDIELNFSTTYASRQPGDPEPSECTRIDW